MPDQTRNELQKRLSSFRHAFQGWSYALRTQRNTWIHGLATIAVVALGFWLDVSRVEWAVLVLAMASVWAAELVNTAVEALIDLASPEISPLAKAAKDVSAGAVLICAVGAILVGLLILGPPLWTRLIG